MKLAKAPAYTVGKSRRTLSLSSAEPLGPGPAGYTVTKGFAEGSPKAHIGLGERSKLAGVGNVPGPGAYRPVTLKKKAPAAILISRKSAKDPQAEQPGPAEYSPLTAGHTPSYSFQGKPIEKPDGRPGPASYEVKPAGKASPKAVFGNSKRLFFDSMTEAPGPIYSPRVPVAVPGGSFGKSKRKEQTSSNVPGPGTYMTPRGNNGVGVMLTGRRPMTTERVREGPGPADYTVNYEDIAPKSGTIAKGPRFPKVSDSNPPPIRLGGDTTTPKGPVFSIGKGKRSDIELNTSVPGPGAYATFDHRDRSPKYSMRIRYSSGPRLIPVSITIGSR